MRNQPTRIPPTCHWPKQITWSNPKSKVREMHSPYDEVRAGMWTQGKGDNKSYNAISPVNQSFICGLPLPLRQIITNVATCTSNLHDNYGGQSPTRFMDDLEHTSGLSSIQVQCKLTGSGKWNNHISRKFYHQEAPMSPIQSPDPNHAKLSMLHKTCQDAQIKTADAADTKLCENHHFCYAHHSFVYLLVCLFLLE